MKSEVFEGSGRSLGKIFTAKRPGEKSGFVPMGNFRRVSHLEPFMGTPRLTRQIHAHIGPDLHSHSRLLASIRE